MSGKLTDFPLSERPRERLINNNPGFLSNAELLAIILSTGKQGENVLDVSRNLLSKFPLNRFSNVSVNELTGHSGIGKAKACKILAAVELGKRSVSFQSRPNPVINSAEDIVKIVKTELSNLRQEHFMVFYIDSRKKLIKKETLFIGTLDSNIIHPREIFSKALSESASAMIFAHNHPSGDPSPSDADIEATLDLAKAGNLLGIEILDHIILGQNRFTSLKQQSYF